MVEGGEGDEDNDRDTHRVTRSRLMTAVWEMSDILDVTDEDEEDVPSPKM